MKITENQIKEMIRLRKKGLSTYKIAEKFNIYQANALYHTSLKYRTKAIERARNKYYGLTKKQKLKKTKSHAEYIKKYFKERYHNDEEFRKKHLSLVKKNKNKK